MDMSKLKGFRTVLVGLGLVILPPALTYLVGVDWNALVGAQGGMMISGALMVLMRVVTTTPIGGAPKQ